MNVIGHAANAVTFAMRVARYRCKIRVQSRSHIGNDKGSTLLGPEDDVDDNKAKGLRHVDGTGFQPFSSGCTRDLGLRPRLR